MRHPDDRIEALLNTLASPKLKTIDLSLERVQRLLAALGNPQDRLPPVVHVAGTNGKGSLLAYLTAILGAAGHKVHRFISPHLVTFNERIMVAGREISNEYLLELLKRISAYSDKYPVTFFEANAALAFLAFAENEADIVLLETGLGGRLDATNTVRDPVLTAIMPISMDHCEFLGNTVSAIAGEKAGIIKSNVPCVIGRQIPEAAEVIEKAARKRNAPLCRFGSEWQVQTGAAGFRYISSKRNMPLPLPNLPGNHQVFNAATAIACLDCLENFIITDKYISYGITHAIWPARLQNITRGRLAELLPDSAELWLDGGHNPGAGEALAGWVKEQKKPVHLICGMLRNKDADQFIMPLAPLIKSFIAVPIEGSQSYTPEELAQTARTLGVKSANAPGAEEAIKTIVKEDKNNVVILICGSLYLAGNILWQNNRL